MTCSTAHKLLVLETAATQLNEFYGAARNGKKPAEAGAEKASAAKDSKRSAARTAKGATA